MKRELRPESSHGRSQRSTATDRLNEVKSGPRGGGSFGVNRRYQAKSQCHEVAQSLAEFLVQGVFHDAGSGVEGSGRDRSGDNNSN